MAISGLHERGFHQSRCSPESAHMRVQPVCPAAVTHSSPYHTIDGFLRRDSMRRPPGRALHGVRLPAECRRGCTSRSHAVRLASCDACGVVQLACAAASLGAERMLITATGAKQHHQMQLHSGGMIVLGSDAQHAARSPLKLFLIELALGWVEAKGGAPLERRYRLPRMRYKGAALVPQTVRLERQALVTELADAPASEPAFPLLTQRRAARVRWTQSLSFRCCWGSGHARRAWSCRRLLLGAGGRACMRASLPAARVKHQAGAVYGMPVNSRTQPQYGAIPSFLLPCSAQHAGYLWRLTHQEKVLQVLISLPQSTGSVSRRYMSFGAGRCAASGWCTSGTCRCQAGEGRPSSAGCGGCSCAGWSGAGARRRQRQQARQRRSCGCACSWYGKGNAGAATAL